MLTETVSVSTFTCMATISGSFQFIHRPIAVLELFFGASKGDWEMTGILVLSH